MKLWKSRWVWFLVCFLGWVLLTGGCASAGAAAQGEVDPFVRQACSRFEPAMQTAALEAVVYAGGPLTARVDRWLCGRSFNEVMVRVIFLHFPDRADPDGARTHDDLIPVVFEDGRYTAFGWALLRREPRRYGVALSLPGEPWQTPPGWVLVQP